MRWLLRLLGALALVAVLAGCRVEASVDVEVAADGSGTVSLDVVFDPAALESLEGLEDGVLLGDLGTAGWTVSRPETGADGSRTITATRSFSSVGELRAALDDLAGPGVFTDVRFESTAEFAERKQVLGFDVDLRRGWSLFSDDEVAAALGGEPFGVPVDQLTDGRTIDQVLGVTIDATLAGDDEQAPISGRYTPRFDDQAVTAVRLEATLENSTAVLVRWIAFALVFLFGLSVLLAFTGLYLQRRAERLRPAPTPSTLSSRIPGRVVVPAPSGVTSSSPSGGDDAVRLVVVEPLSVLYHRQAPVDNELLRFVREQGGDARADVLLDAHDELIRGRIETADLWEIAGINGDPDTIDDQFVARRPLRKEAPAFLRELERRRIPVAAVTNDAASWSSMARHRDRLSGVWPWLVSGELGAVTPDPGLFERLRRETGTAYAHCLYIDGRVDSLDAARDLGMRTALYAADDHDLPDVVGHPVVKNLLQLVRRAT